MINGGARAPSSPPVATPLIDKIEENKEEIMSIVHKERTTRIGASVTNIVIGSGLAITGIALAPFTFGGSIAISVLGGVLGMAAAGAGFATFVTSKVLCNKKLKKAQQHINLDQQISLIINEEAAKYNQIMIAVPSNVPESSAIVFQGAAATVRGAGAGIAIAIDGTVETAAVALRTTGRIAGMALAGASLAVTIPIDIGFIVYHSYHIHKSKNDQTGKTESNEAVKILYNEVETLFKGMCHAINEVEYEVHPGRNIIKDDGCGYEIKVPVKGNKKHTVTVRTLFSGPFVYPEGYTLVSAVYDITMPELSQPATIKLEHCVDESDKTEHCVGESDKTEHCVGESDKTEHCVDESDKTEHCIDESDKTEHCVDESDKTEHCVDELDKTEHCVDELDKTEHCVDELDKTEHCVDESDKTKRNMYFAIGSCNLKDKEIQFKIVQEFNGSIQQKGSCLLCILYKRKMYMQDKKSVRYVAQCFYNRKYKNFWTLNIVFTKLIYANFKHAQNRSGLQGSYYPFVFNSDSLSLDLTCFKDTKLFSGWIVSPSDDEEIPDTISMEKIDIAEKREGGAKVLKKAFPSISLCVYIFDETTAAAEINESFEIGGTSLSININRRKEKT